MKRAITFLFMTFLFAGVFAQGNAEYQAQLAKAKEFEENRQYINALHCYYEAMNAEPTLEAEEAYNAYNNILEEIAAGKPGHGEFDDFTLYDGWYALCIEYEQFWTKHCPYVFDLKLVDDSKLLDMEKRTASYAFEKKRYENYFFSTINGAMKKGMEKSRTKSWKGIPEQWPAVSIYHDEKSSFMKNGIALFNITKDGESFFAPMFDSRYYELPNTYEYTSWGYQKPKYSSDYHSGSTLYDVKFDIKDKNGNLLFSVPRVLYDNGYKTEFSRISVEKLSPTIMKIIDSGEYEVKVTGIYLQYGKPAWNSSEERSSYTSENRLWMKGLPEITYDAEKEDKITLYSDSSVSKIFISKYLEEAFAYAEGGTFTMGRWVLFGESNERPEHKVTLTPFYIAKNEVTEKQWDAVMGTGLNSNSSKDYVSWYDAIVFCNKLSMMDERIPVYSINGKTNPDEWNYLPYRGNSLSGDISMDLKADGYRLPTEAEWEFTAKKQEELGVSNMFGSVREWCWDWYAWYGDGPQSDPTGPDSGNNRVLRNIDASARSYDNPSKQSKYVGFRLAHSRSEKEIAMEQERIENERLEKERLEQEKLEQERLEKEREEQERLRQEQERLEKERLEQERLEKERIERENQQVIDNLLRSFIYVEGGQFKMGSTNIEKEKDERPVHNVTISSFSITKREITQEQWRVIMNSDPSWFMGDILPVENVSWYDAIVFCNKLSIRTGMAPVYSFDGKTDPDEWNYIPCQGNSLSGTISMNINADGYRLPTEAEWEHAARGGNKSKGYRYSGSNTKKDVAWYVENSNNQTHRVNLKASNELGLSDMSGNVGEWCWDLYGSYTKEPQTDPTGSSSGSSRVWRGGSFNDVDINCRIANRNNANPEAAFNNLGFRIVSSKSKYENSIALTSISYPVTIEETVKEVESVNEIETAYTNNVSDNAINQSEDDYFPLVFSAGYQTPLKKLFDASEFLISASLEIHDFIIYRSLVMCQVDFYYPEGFDYGFVPLFNLNLGLQFGWKYGLGIYGGLGCSIPGLPDDIDLLWKWTGGVRLLLNRISLRGEVSCLNNRESDDKKYMIGMYLGIAPF